MHQNAAYGRVFLLWRGLVWQSEPATKRYSSRYFYILSTVLK